MSTKKSNSLSSFSSSGKSVVVHSRAKKSTKKSSGVLYEKMLSQESEDMKRLSKWHTSKVPKTTSSSTSEKVQKISGFTKSKDGKIVGVKKQTKK